MTIDEAIQRFANSRDECLNSATETYQKFLNYQDQYYKGTSQTLEKTAMEFDQIAEWLKELKELRMRDATLEERKSVDNYVKSISKDTGVTFEQNSPSQMPGTSNDAVSRVLAIETAIEAADEWDGGYDITREQIIRDALEKLPSVQPEPKFGHWVDDHCSECGYGVLPWNNTPFCPNCGARMRG